MQSPCGFAIESGGTTALLLDCSPNASSNCTTTGRISRVDLTTGVAETPIATGLNSPKGVAIEVEGVDALVTDCGPSGGSCSTGGRLLRVDLSSGSYTPPLTSNLNTPDGIAVDTVNQFAYVAEKGAGRVLKVDLVIGTFTEAASGLQNPRHVVLESGGTVLVATDLALQRVNPETHAVSTVSMVDLERFALESGGATALVAGRGTDNTLSRVNLMTGAVSVLAVPGLFDAPFGFAIESGGTTALVTENRGTVLSQTATGALLRFAVPGM